MSRRKGGVIASVSTFIVGEHPTTTVMPRKCMVIPGALNGSGSVVVVVNAEGISEQRSELELYRDGDNLAAHARC